MITIAANTDITSGLAGGLLIGVAATWLMYSENQIMGISGISAQALTPVVQQKNYQDLRGYWSWSFLAGILATGSILTIFQPEVFGTSESPAAVLSPLGAAVAGVLTGFGTRLGSGCTSGHGICGLPRRSPRSLTAVLTFITTGGITTYAINNSNMFAAFFSGSGCSHVAGGVINAEGAAQIIQPLVILIGGIICAALLLRSKKNETAEHMFGKELATKQQNEPTVATHATSFLVGVLFSIGLSVGGMTDPSRVSGFLNLTSASGWDATLMGVMGGGVLANLMTFEYMRRNGHGSSCEVFKFDGHENNMKIDSSLLLGAALFGCGWGLSGVCPGPALASLPGALWGGLGNGAMVLYIPFMLLGMAIHK